MSYFKDYPQIIAAVIAGIFAIICKFLERRPSESSSGKSRGFAGWLVIIAAAAAIVLSIYSITVSRQQLSPLTWNEHDQQGAVIIGDTLICYGYVEASTGVPDDRQRIFTVKFPNEFADDPVLTDSILPKNLGKGVTFNAANYEISHTRFTVHTWVGRAHDDYTDRTIVRYNWMATGRIKQ